MTDREVMLLYHLTSFPNAHACLKHKPQVDYTGVEYKHQRNTWWTRSNATATLPIHTPFLCSTCKDTCDTIHDFLIYVQLWTIKNFHTFCFFKLGHIVMWMQQSCICILVILREMLSCVQIYFVFRCHIIFYENKITSSSDPTKSWIVFSSVFSKSTENSILPKCQQQACCIQKTKCSDLTE